MVGAEGETVDTDQYGRVKVWMPWDESNPDKDHTMSMGARNSSPKYAMDHIDEVILMRKTSS